MKIYYTVRELSTRTAELWALRSLGDEIFVKDDGYKGWAKEALPTKLSIDWKAHGLMLIVEEK